MLRMLPIAKPCSESFDDMRGDERTRWCDKCEKRVHDLSAGTEEEARALFRDAGGKRVCVRFARDARGAVRFGLAAAAALSLASCSSAMPESPPSTAVEAVDRETGDTIPDLDDCEGTCPPPDAGARRD